MKILFLLFSICGLCRTAFPQEHFAPVAKELDRYLSSLQGLSGKAVVTSSMVLGIAVAPDGVMHKEAQSFNKDLVIFRWNCKDGWIATDTSAQLPTSVKTADGSQAWSFSNASSYNTQTRLGPDGEVFMDSILFGPNVRGWPDKVVLPPYTTRICYVKTPSNMRTLSSLDVRALFSFGNAPLPYMQWADFIRPLDEAIGSGIATIDVMNGTSENGEETIELKVSSTKTNDVFEFAFYKEKGFLPCQFVDYRDSLVSMKQQWTWNSVGGQWVPATYKWMSDRIVDSGGGKAEWIFENVSAESDGKYDMSSLIYEKYDRVFDEINNKMYVFDGSKLVSLKKAEDEGRKKSTGFRVLWITAVFLSIVFFFRWARSRSAQE